MCCAECAANDFYSKHAIGSGNRLGNITEAKHKCFSGSVETATCEQIES